MGDRLLAEAIANYMVVNGTAGTTSGNRIFQFDELCSHFGMTHGKLMEIMDDIESCLANCPQVMDEDGIWVDEESFSLMFWGNYCDVDCGGDEENALCHAVSWLHDLGYGDKEISREIHLGTERIKELRS